MTRAAGRRDHGQRLGLVGDVRRPPRRWPSSTCRTRCGSSRRTARRWSMVDYAQQAAGRGLRVIIAGAGGAAHLPGMVASLTPLPVIGVPVPLKYLDGMDSLLSIVQMPAGVPVATVSIGGARNAGLLAVRILAAADAALTERMLTFQAAPRRLGRRQGRGSAAAGTGSEGLGPAEGPIAPARRAPLGRVEHVASVDQVAPGHQPADRLRLHRPELLPFGQQHEQVGATDGLVQRVGELQLRVCPTGVLAGLGS